MLELRLTADPKRMASMRDAVARECGRVDVGPEHAAVVALVAEQLIGGESDGRRSGRSPEVFVLITVQSDATMLMVRDPRPERAELGDRRHRLLEQYTTRWSTMSGRDGRTIWAEIERDAVLATEHAARVAEVPTPAPTTTAETGSRAWSRPVRFGLGTIPTFAAPD
jgi:hypothetical protein